MTKPTGQDKSSAGEILKRSKAKVLSLWEERTRREIAAAAQKESFALRDELPRFLDNLAGALSPLARATDPCAGDVCAEHGAQRAHLGDYTLEQILTEYSILRKTVLEVIEVEGNAPLSSVERDIVLDSISQGLSEAGAAFAAANTAKLQRANQDLQNFAYLASHDLQEPIRTVSNYIEMLERKVGDGLDAEGKLYFKFVTEGAQRMGALVDGLLAYSRIGSEPADSEPVKLDEAFRMALLFLRPLVDQAGAAVSAEPLPQVRGREVEFTELFRRLIENALIFRGPDTKPEIRITAAIRDQDWLLGVEDNGIGVPEAYREKIFGLFKRLHPRTKYPGVGLGLSVCQKIVALQGGRLWHEPNPSGGSRFLFTLPIRS